MAEWIRGFSRKAEAFCLRVVERQNLLVVPACDGGDALTTTAGVYPESKARRRYG